MTNNDSNSKNDSNNDTLYKSPVAKKAAALNGLRPRILTYLNKYGFYGDTLGKVLHYHKYYISRHGITVDEATQVALDMVNERILTVRWQMAKPYFVVTASLKTIVGERASRRSILTGGDTAPLLGSVDAPVNSAANLSADCVELGAASVDELEAELRAKALQSVTIVKDGKEEISNG